MEELAILRQAFSICVWLEMHTKLKTILFLNGKEDLFRVEVFLGEEQLIDFKLESVTKKNEVRVEHEIKLLIAQLLELKNNEHYLK